MAEVDPAEGDGDVEAAVAEGVGLGSPVVEGVVGGASAPAERAGTVLRVVLVYEFFMGGEAVSPR